MYNRIMGGSRQSLEIIIISPSLIRMSPVENLPELQAAQENNDRVSS